MLLNTQLEASRLQNDATLETLIYDAFKLQKEASYPPTLLNTQLHAFKLQNETKDPLILEASKLQNDAEL
jgi:hypothetical protein